MASLVPETHAKTASHIAPKGGKQSVRLYAVRLLGRWRCPLHPRSIAATLAVETKNAPVAPRVAPCATFTPSVG